MAFCSNRRVSTGRVLAWALLLVGASCSPEKQQTGSAPAIPVVIGTAVRKDVPVELRAIGTVEAYATVAIRARVGGELLGVHFQEGQNVTEGDLLFEIDPRPYESALQEAEANLARDRARLKNAEDNARRYAELVTKEYVTKERFNLIVSEAEALKAVVQGDEAAAETARLNLGFCRIRAPITGRTGSLLVHRGNLVQANSEQPLVVIHQIQPVRVNFSVPEQYLNEVRNSKGGESLPVTAYLPPGSSVAAQGRLSFLDNKVDEATGTILLKATFPNEDRLLWPGQFVNVVLTVATLPGAVVVPSQAVQPGQKGDQVFVVTPESRVELRAVTAGRRVGDDLVIEQGLNAGERVVTDGQLRLVPGARVEERTGLGPEGETERAGGEESKLRARAADREEATPEQSGQRSESSKFLQHLSQPGRPQ